MYRVLALILLAIFSFGATAAEQQYLSVEAFVNNAFDGQPPNPKSLWVIAELGAQASAILGHPPNNLRERYWRQNNRSVWILEEVGKERLFTVGWVVEGGKIRETKVLTYRETRGWEVRYPFFTQQFEGAELTPKQELNRNIDGISGATLSVRAMRRMAELALLLDRHISREYAAR